MIIYLELFISFLKIGLFSFGGGYAALPLIREQVVDYHRWLEMSEFTDLVTISQMTPGPIAINAATFVGIRTGGTLGAVVATLGCILPSCIIATAIAWVYTRYRKLDLIQGILGSLRPAVVALIASAGLSILVTAFWGTQEAVSLSETHWFAVAIFIICVILLKKAKMSPVPVMVLAGVLQVAYSGLSIWMR